MRRVFSFQAEDGIRDKLVTAVQTCALPIFFDVGQMKNAYTAVAVMQLVEMGKLKLEDVREPLRTADPSRSEERRVGKSVDLGGGRMCKKKSIDTKNSRRANNIPYRSVHIND